MYSFSTCWTTAIKDTYIHSKERKNNNTKPIIQVDSVDCILKREEKKKTGSTKWKRIKTMYNGILFSLLILDASHYKCDGHTTNRWNKIRHTHTHSYAFECIDKWYMPQNITLPHSFFTELYFPAAVYSSQLEKKRWIECE